MTREKLKEVIKKAYEAEISGHSFRDPTADHIGNLADRILAALDSERVEEQKNSDGFWVENGSYCAGCVRNRGRR